MEINKQPTIEIPQRENECVVGQSHAEIQAVD